jgi:hypothetical protein
LLLRPQHFAGLMKPFCLFAMFDRQLMNPAGFRLRHRAVLVIRMKANGRFWPIADLSPDAFDVAFGRKADLGSCTAHVCF